MQVLTIKDMESIQAAHTQAQKAFTLIAILRCEGNNGFTLFLEALKRNGYEELANKIENTFVVITPRDEHVTKSTRDEHLTKSTRDEHVTDSLRGKHGTELPHDEHDTESHTERGRVIKGLKK